MRKPTAKQIKAMNDARVQRAISGLQIRMTALVKVSAHAHALIAEGVDDETLAAKMQEYVNGGESA